MIEKVDPPEWERGTMKRDFSWTDASQSYRRNRHANRGPGK